MVDIGCVGRVGSGTGTHGVLSWLVTPQVALYGDRQSEWSVSMVWILRLFALFWLALLPGCEREAVIKQETPAEIQRTLEKSFLQDHLEDVRHL